MARLNSRVLRVCPSSFFTLLSLGLLLSGCGGGSTQTSQSAVDGIVNGGTLATASSHWTGKTCALQGELTSDHGFLSLVTDTSGNTTVAELTWTAAANGDSVTVSPLNSGGMGAAITAISGISGSVASQQFTAGVIVKSGSTPQNLGSCSFALTKGGLALPATRSAPAPDGN